eukprot:4066142-Pleurochrysis_carterae.AAC.2
MLPTSGCDNMRTARCVKGVYENGLRSDLDRVVEEWQQIEQLLRELWRIKGEVRQHLRRREGEGQVGR